MRSMSWSERDEAFGEGAAFAIGHSAFGREEGIEAGGVEASGASADGLGDRSLDGRSASGARRGAAITRGGMVELLCRRLAPHGSVKPARAESEGAEGASPTLLAFCGRRRLAVWHRSWDALLRLRSSFWVEEETLVRSMRARASALRERTAMWASRARFAAVIRSALRSTHLTSAMSVMPRCAAIAGSGRSAAMNVSRM